MEDFVIAANGLAIVLCLTSIISQLRRVAEAIERQNVIIADDPDANEED